MSDNTVSKLESEEPSKSSLGKNANSNVLINEGIEGTSQSPKREKKRNKTQDHREEGSSKGIRSKASTPMPENKDDTPSTPNTQTEVSSMSDPNLIHSPNNISLPRGSVSIVSEGGGGRIQRRRNNPLQRPDTWNFLPSDEIDPKLHSKHSKRHNIALEICSTESSYYASLQHMVTNFVLPCSELISPNDLATIFGNIVDLTNLHKQFSKDVEERLNSWTFQSTIGDIFLKYAPKLTEYSGFINTYEKGVALMTELAKKNPAFNELLQNFSAHPDTHSLDIGAFRILPVQRLPRLVLLLEDLLRTTIIGHPDFSNVRDALSRIRDVSSEVNAAKGVAAMNEYAKSIASRLHGLPINENWVEGGASSDGRDQSSLNKALPGFRLIQSDKRGLIIEDTPMILYSPKEAVFVSLALFSDGILISKRDENSVPATESRLDFLGWCPVKVTRICKIGSKQVQRAAKEWKTSTQSIGNFDSLHWMEIQVREIESYFVGVDNLKFWHDWHMKFQATKASMRSKYWSIVSQYNAPPACAYSTRTLHPASNTLYFYGGASNKLLNEFWAYNLTLKCWVRIMAQGTPPPALAKHSSCVIGSKLYIFGGLIKNTVTVHSDLYIYDITSNTWILFDNNNQTNKKPENEQTLKNATEEQATGPRSRAGHTMTVVGTKFYIIGGAYFDHKNQETILDDCYEFDTVSQVWTMLPKMPIARHGHISSYIDGKIYVWGGRSPGAEPDSSINSASNNNNSNSFHFPRDVLIFDLSTRQWSPMSDITGFVPIPRQWASGVTIKNKYVLVTGGKRDTTLLNDIYLLDVISKVWCRYSLPSVLDPRMSHCVQVLESRSGAVNIYIFGGLQMNEQAFDTTIYSNSFITFQLHNKYIQLEPTPELPPNKLNTYTVSSLAAIPRFTFVSKSGTILVSDQRTLQSDSSQLENNNQINNYTMNSLIGSSNNFGELWKVIQPSTNSEAVCRVIKVSPTSDDISTSLSSSSSSLSIGGKKADSKIKLLDSWQTLSKQVELLTKLKSNYLTKFIGYLNHLPDQHWLLFEYCQYGSLKDFLNASTSPRLKENQLQFLAFVMLYGLYNLHSQNLVHGNLHASNIVLDQDLEFKLTDYGVAPILRQLLQKNQPKHLGFWVAPEVLLGGTHSSKSDIYALGITLIELAENTQPFAALQQKKERKWSSSMEDFISRCSISDEKGRPDVDTLLNHPWIKSIKSFEKIQLDLAELVKKTKSKERKRQESISKSPSSSSLSQSNSSQMLSITTQSPPVSIKVSTQKSPSSPDLIVSSPSSGKLRPNRKGTTISGPSPNTTDTQDEKSDIEIKRELAKLKAKNSQLRKKLKLLEQAYSALESENTKLKESMQQQQ